MKPIIQYILYHLARAVLKKYHPDVIGITGSVGKTSVKEVLGYVLQSHFNVKWSKKSYNNELGVPLTILLAERSAGRSFVGWMRIFLHAISLLTRKNAHYPSVLILEMGADSPGNISYLTTLAPCRVGIITAISPTHLEKLGSLELLAKEKKIIIEHLKGERSCAILNADDENIFEERSNLRVPVLSYGLNPKADVSVKKYFERYIFTNGEWKSRINGIITYKDKEYEFENTHIIGLHSLSSLLAGITGGIFYAIPLPVTLQKISQVVPVPGRMKGLKGIKKSFIIDDTYNSSPKAAHAALEVMQKIQIDEGGRRIVILGDMLELGSVSDEEHNILGKKVVESRIDILITVGSLAQEIGISAIANGLDPKQVVWFDSSVSAASYVRDIIHTGDVMLVKGSQGVRLEYIVKRIMAEPEHAQELLVRHDSEWMKN